MNAERIARAAEAAATNLREVSAETSESESVRNVSRIIAATFESFALELRAEDRG